MSTLKSGDVVQLKSGGALMTVQEKYDDGSVSVVFYSERVDNFEKLELNESVLIKVEGEFK